MNVHDLLISYRLINSYIPLKIIHRCGSSAQRERANRFRMPENGIEKECWLANVDFSNRKIKQKGHILLFSQKKKRRTKNAPNAQLNDPERRQARVEKNYWKTRQIHFIELKSIKCGFATRPILYSLRSRQIFGAAKCKDHVMFARQSNKQYTQQTNDSRSFSCSKSEISNGSTKKRFALSSKSLICAFVSVIIASDHIVSNFGGSGSTITYQSSL